MFALLLACVAASPELGGLPDAAGPDLDPGFAGDPTPDDDLEDPVEDPVEDPEPVACDGFESAVLAGRLPDALDEVSGLVASRAHPGVLWALEDSGNAAALYALDIDGSVLATVQVPAVNRDWEDLAIAPCGDTDCLWIADVGDNQLVRDDTRLVVVQEPAIADGSARIVRTVEVDYADGPHNVEALVVDAAGEPTLFGKQDDGRSAILRRSGDTFRSVASLEVAGLGDDAWASRVTAADLWTDGGGLLVRTYGRAWQFDLGDDGVAAVADAEREELEAPAQAQVEAVAWDPTIGGWWQTTEGVGAELYFVACAP